MDFTVIFNDKEDQRAKCREITEHAKNWQTRCSANFPDRGTLFGRVRTPWNEERWVSVCGVLEMEHTDYYKWHRELWLWYSSIYFTYNVQSSMTRIRVPRDFCGVLTFTTLLKVCSRTSVDTRNVEYGMGCWEMAYQLVTAERDIPKTVQSIDFRNRLLWGNTSIWERFRERASCLARHGCASFISCLEHWAAWAMDVGCPPRDGTDSS